MTQEDPAVKLARRVVVLQREVAVARQKAEHARSQAAVALAMWIGTVALAIWFLW